MCSRRPHVFSIALHILVAAIILRAGLASAHRPTRRGLKQSLVVNEERRHTVLQKLWRSPLALQSPDAPRMFRSGFKHELQGRNWRRLSIKLATPGSNVTVVVFGGSVTVGHYPSCDNSSWVEEAWHWMEAAFPEVNFNFVNLGHGATSANLASLCYYHDLPTEADLVLIEYSLNGCGALQCLRISQPEVSSCNWQQRSSSKI